MRLACLYGAHDRNEIGERTADACECGGRQHISGLKPGDASLEHRSPVIADGELDHHVRILYPSPAQSAAQGFFGLSHKNGKSQVTK